LLVFNSRAIARTEPLCFDLKTWPMCEVELKREFGGFDATAPTGTQFPSRVDRNARRTPSVRDATSRLWPELGAPGPPSSASLPLGVAAAFIAGRGAVALDPVMRGSCGS
jgi:hypothetical protein